MPQALDRDEIDMLMAMLALHTRIIEITDAALVHRCLEETRRATGHILFASKAEAVHAHNKVLEKLNFLKRETIS